MKRLMIVIAMSLSIFFAGTYVAEGEGNIGWEGFPPTLGITLRDGEDGDGSLKGEGKEYIIVSVAAVNLEIGMEHLLKVKLLDSLEGTPVFFDGAQAMEERKILPKKMAEVAEFRFAIDGEEHRGRSLMAEVTLVKNGEEIVKTLSSKFQGGTIAIGKVAEEIKEEAEDVLEVEEIEKSEELEEGAPSGEHSFSEGNPKEKIEEKEEKEEEAETQEDSVKTIKLPYISIPIIFCVLMVLYIKRKESKG